MSDLRERVARIIRQAADDCADKMPGAEHYAADAILALVRADEAAIRADERAKVREAAQSDEAVERFCASWFAAWHAYQPKSAMPGLREQARAAILAALGG